MLKNEGDKVLGVIVENAPVVGDANWNAWKDKMSLIQELKNLESKRKNIKLLNGLTMTVNCSLDGIFK